MFDITYKENALSPDRVIQERATYDFTFENRFHIYHRPRRKLLEYIALDKRTNRTSLVVERQAPLLKEEYPLLIPDILFSIKYTGDMRYTGAIEYTAENLIDLIFRVIMPKYGYAIREQQIQMAKHIHQGLTTKKVTLCEAEVGSGKTMAYLVAGYVAKQEDTSYKHTGYPVMISTSSIELQKAIMDKEIPALSRMLKAEGLIKKPLQAILRKGKEHYFCPRRYQELLDSLLQYPDKYGKTIQSLRGMDLCSWALDLDRLPLQAHVKGRICVKGSCNKCPRAAECRYAKFLASATDPHKYDFQITNHNLFLTAQKLRDGQSGKRGLLPCNFCIVDEAHKLPETALAVFGSQISFSEVEDYLRSVVYHHRPDMLDHAAYKRLLTEAARANKKLLSMFDHYRFDAQEDVCEVKFELTPAMASTIVTLGEKLDRIGKWLLPPGANASSASALTEKLAAFLVPAENLYWISYDKITQQKALCCMPTDLQEHLSKALWKQPNTHYALTSGTMRDDTGFSFFKEELGITNCLDDHCILEYTCGSPFDYKNHTRLYISENTPLPDMKDPDYIPAIAREVIRLIRATNGHTAVLFTSYRVLNEVYDQVAEQLTDYDLIKMTRSNKTAISQFKESKNAILFASGCMWEGVDCPGDILSSVIIVRLPFPLRTQALESKRESCANTGEFVQKYAVPQMLIKLRQGAGRLIRTETDTGILAILDARAAKGGPYRARVLKALNKYPQVSSISKAAAFIDSVKDRSYRGEVDA